MIWAEVEAIERIAESKITVRYAGEAARLDREKLWRRWALWRGVMFVSSRSGRAANLLDAIWQDHYGRAAGAVPPVMQMPLAEAMTLLGVPANYTETTSSMPSGAQRRKPIPTSAARPNCSLRWSRPAIGCWRPWERARLHRRRLATRRRECAWSTAVSALSSAPRASCQHGSAVGQIWRDKLNHIAGDAPPPRVRPWINSLAQDCQSKLQPMRARLIRGCARSRLRCGTVIRRFGL